MSLATALMQPEAKSKPRTSKKEATLLLPKPTPKLRYFLREAANVALGQHLTYKEAQDLFRVFLLDSALRIEQQVKTAAAKRLGISRDHVRDFHKRGEGVF